MVTFMRRLRKHTRPVYILAGLAIVAVLTMRVSRTFPEITAQPWLWTFWLLGFACVAWWCPHIAGKNVLLGFGPDILLLSTTLILPERNILWPLIMCLLCGYCLLWSRSLNRSILAIVTTILSALPGRILSEYLGGITAFDGQDHQQRMTSMTLLIMLCLTFSAARLCFAVAITLYTEGGFPGSLKHLNWTQLLIMPFAYCVTPAVLISLRSLPPILANTQWNEAFNVLLALLGSAATFRLIEEIGNALSKRQRLYKLERASDTLSVSTKHIMDSATKLLASIYPRMRVELGEAPRGQGRLSSSLQSEVISSPEGELRIIVVRRVWNRPFDDIDRLVVNLISSMLRIIYRVRIETNRLTLAANTDPLTGLSNYRGFEADLNRQDIMGNPGDSAAIFMDIDNFKSINDTYGHQAGNDVLQSLARRLVEAVGEDKLIARLGGDEFVVVLTGAHTQRDAKRYVDSIEECVNRPVMTSSGPIPLHISHGLAFTRADADYRSLLEEADARMYASRRNRAVSRNIPATFFNRIASANNRQNTQRQMGETPLASVPQVSDGVQPTSPVVAASDRSPQTRSKHPLPTHTEAAHTEATQSNQATDSKHILDGRRTQADIIASAIQRDTIQIHYQPIINLNTRRILALEALLRYHDPDLGDVPVGEILRVAKERDLTGAISESMLMHAVADAGIFHDIEEELSIVNVNVTMSDLLDPLFRTHLQQAVVSHPELHIIIEITEDSLSTSMEDELKSVEDFVKTHHIDLALDDAGTIYSELAVLIRLPVRVVKIDKSIVDRLPNSRVSTLMSGFVATCDRLNIEVVFEGIENEDQERSIKALGGRLVQGFLYGRPINAMETAIRLQISGLRMQPYHEWPLSPDQKQDREWTQGTRPNA